LVAGNSKIIIFANYQWRKRKKALFKNKAESNAVATNSDTKRNILRESLFYSNDSIKKRAELSRSRISSRATRNWEENKSLLYGLPENGT
jgi:hypothetical protein